MEYKVSSVVDPGEFLGFRGTPLFVVLRACVAGLVRVHKRSRKRSGQRNPPPPPPPPFKILDLPLVVLDVVESFDYALALH